jgi:homoserine acetyltransferase
LGRHVVHAELESSAGHDAFLVDNEPQAPIVTDFLGSL